MSANKSKNILENDFVKVASTSLISRTFTLS